MKTLVIVMMLMAGFFGIAQITAQESQPAAPEAAPVATAEMVAEPAAEVDDTDVAMDDLEDYTYGTVVSAAADTLVISEFDDMENKEIEVTYAIDSATEIENIDAIDKLVAGDPVEITFKETDGKRIATAVAKEIEDMNETADDMEE